MVKIGKKAFKLGGKKKNIPFKAKKKTIKHPKKTPETKLNRVEEKEEKVDKYVEQELNKSDSESEGEDAYGSDDSSITSFNGADSGDDDTDQEANGDEESEDEMQAHKESLNKLKESDPEFYKFLEENDKNLLSFNLSDGDDDDEKDDQDQEDVHVPTGDLEIASDESDFEPDDDDDKKPVDKRIITLRMLKTWQSDIQTDKTSGTIRCLVNAFHAALVRVSSDDEKQEPTEYKVDGSSVFNAVIQLCVLELVPAFRRFLKLSANSKQPPHKCKRFVKIKFFLKSYIKDLLKLLGGVTSTNILNVLLKHLHNTSPLIVSFPQTTKQLLKKLIQLWGTCDDSVRVIAFLCILRITNNQQISFLSTVLKSMYLTYIKNSKFVSLGTLPMINFMRRSLIEIFTLDLNVSYQHVFLYIRQLAIHLRNAVTLQKKENNQAVYNWQYVNSLRLWGGLLGATCNKPQLQPLIYPFVQVTIGVIKLLPTTQYYPIRIHCVDVLMELSATTGTYIPVLPFLLEVLNSYDFNKKHQKVSMKPMHFTCMLRSSKSQLVENGFKDALIEALYERLLEYLASQSHTVAFPDLSLNCILQLKQFVKKCAVANYSKKMRQLLEKIEQSAQFIETERNKITYNITDYKQIDGWETTIKNKGTPLSTYYESWNKLRTIKKNKQATNNEAMGDYDLPILTKKNKLNPKSKPAGPVELFPSDSEADDEAVDENRFEEKKKPKKTSRGKRAGKNVNKSSTLLNEDDSMVVDSVPDIVQDIKASDW